MCDLHQRSCGPIQPTFLPLLYRSFIHHLSVESKCVGLPPLAPAVEISVVVAHNLTGRGRRRRRKASAQVLAFGFHLQQLSCVISLVTHNGVCSCESPSACWAEQVPERRLVGREAPEGAMRHSFPIAARALSELDCAGSEDAVQSCGDGEGGRA